MLGRILKVTDRIVMGVSILALAAIVLIVLLQVLLRYVFHVPFTWSHELAAYLFVAISALVGAVVLGERGHFTVPLLADALPRRPRLVLDLFVIVACAVFALIVVVKGTELALKLQRLRTPVLQISEAIPNAILPIMGAYMLLHLINHLIQTIAELRSGSSPK